MLQVRWTYHVVEDARATVFPDGCRDLIVQYGRKGRPKIVLTDWDRGVREAPVPAGTTMIGYRLRPGVMISADRIRALVGHEDKIDRFIASEAAVDVELEQIIGALSRRAANVEKVARTAGVTRRTLQRRFDALKLPSPDFWRLLGRARRTAGALPGPHCLAEIALAHGYSDQAHMTREFVRWFGRPPAQLREDRAALGVLSQPGLGNWTGEQISIT